MIKKYNEFINNLLENNNLTNSDMQLLRKGIALELNAINDYESFAMSAENEIVKLLFMDIAKEEKVHAEEFDSLLSRLDPDYDEVENDGEEEIDNIFNNK